MRPSNLLALAASISTSLAVYQGFNYGSTNPDGSFKFQADYENEFKAAKSLVGTSGFSSARLYTMIQGGSSTNEPTQAIPAAIAQDTTLLLGLWASGGQGGLDAEITALKSAIAQYGTAFTSRVAGISVGSEDLYRISPTGIAAKSGYGAEPATVAAYIGQVKQAIQGTPLSGASVGHVDTWTAWVNSTNQAVIDACDWIGVDAYPYFQNTQSNGIENGASLFEAALAQTQAAVGGKEMWITETGWPVSGPTQNLAVPSLENAKTYWDQVGCPRFGKINTWWFTLVDAGSSPSFGIVNSETSTTPLYDLSCNAVSSSSSSASSAATQAPSSAQSSSAVASASQSSVEASVSSAVASGPLASSGGGLSPSQGAGNGIPPVSVSSSATSATEAVPGSVTTQAVQPSSNISVSGGAQPSTALTTQTTVVAGSGSAGPSARASSTGPETVSGNGAAVVTGSFVAAMGALFAAAAAL